MAFRPGLEGFPRWTARDALQHGCPARAVCDLGGQTRGPSGTGTDSTRIRLATGSIADNRTVVAREWLSGRRQNGHVVHCGAQRSAAIAIRRDRIVRMFSRAVKAAQATLRGGTILITAGYERTSRVGDVSALIACSIDAVGRRRSNTLPGHRESSAI